MILKLPNLGDEATFTVQSCERVEGNFGPQIRFTAQNGDQLFLPADTAEQRIRFAFGVESSEECDIGMCVGNTLRFFREPNKTKGAKPYWALEIAANAKPQPKSERIPSPYREPGQRGPTTVPGGELPEPPHGGLPPDWSDDLPPVPPELAGPVAENESGDQRTYRVYIATLKRVLTDLAPTFEAAGVPLDGETVQAVSFSIQKRCWEKGWL